jgi:squalene synthase HpnC
MSAFSHITSPISATAFTVPVEHYENFPVASILLPPHLRQPIEVIYAFARSADDFADEGNDPIPVRLEKLAAYARELDVIESGGESHHPLFKALAVVIHTHSLPISLFRDLLDAFSQDVTVTSYDDFAALMDYCRRSADPIGRLLLHLMKSATPEHLVMSDKICSALQLINHWQDIAIDWKKNTTGRVYLPREDLVRFGLTTNDIQHGVATAAWREMMAFQVARARQMMLDGAPLAHRMRGRFGAELRLIVAGGLRIADKIDTVGGDVFNHRPKLGMWDWIRIAPSVLPRL